MSQYLSSHEHFTSSWDQHSLSLLSHLQGPTCTLGYRMKLCMCYMPLAMLFFTAFLLPVLQIHSSPLEFGTTTVCVLHL